MTPTGFIYDNRYLEHDVGLLTYELKNGNKVDTTSEFENPFRAIVIKDMLEKTGLLARMSHFLPYDATDEDLLRVHSRKHIEWVQEACFKGIRVVGPEAYAVSASERIARLAAGGAMKAVDVCFMEDEIDQSYALIRPPGHHATRDKAMGFCLYNNIAVAASYAIDRYGLNKVLVLDWDVHHGNGTEEIFYDNDEVLVISLHEENYFPIDSGNIEHVGKGRGEGFNINIPLPPLTGNEGYQLAFDKIVIPVIEEFQPELILVSAGQDANALDPLSRMMLLRNGFQYMAKAVRETAQKCSSKLVVLQEGGYSLHYLPIATLGVIEGLMDCVIDFEDPHILPERNNNNEVKKVLRNVIKTHSKYWSNLNNICLSFRKMQ